jgi:hypothetical protein
MFVYFHVKVIFLVTVLFTFSAHSRHVCLHSVRIAAIFIFSAHSRHVCLHSCKMSLTLSRDCLHPTWLVGEVMWLWRGALVGQRAWSSSDVIQILQSDWTAIPGPSLLTCGVNFYDTRKLSFNLRKKLVLEHICVGCWNMNTSESRLEISGKFWNVVLQKDVENQLHRSVRNEEVLLKSEGGEEHPTYNKKRGRLTGLVTSWVGTAF